MDLPPPSGTLAGGMQPLLRVLFARAPVAFALLDPAMRFLMVNEQLATLSGLPVDAHLGQPAAELLAPHVPALVALLHEVATSGQPRQDVELSAVTADQSRHWRCGAYPLRETGPLVGFGLFAVEITSSTAAASSLHAGEASFRLLAERAADLIYRYRLAPEPGFEYVSPTATAFTGYTPEEHYADPQLGFRLVHPNDRMLLEAIAAGVEAARPILLRWVRKDGNIIWTEQRNAVVRDPEGRPVAIEGIARDVTDRRRAEEALSQALESERHARHVSEVLHSAHLALTRSLDPDEVMDALLDHLQRLVPYDSANVILLEGERRLVVQAARGYERFAATQHPLGLVLDPTDDPVLQPILTRRRSFLVMDTARAARWRRRPGVEHVRNWFGVPLVSGDQVLGLFSVDKATPEFFTPEHVDLAELLATTATIALQNARLFAEVKHGEERMRALSERLVAVQETERAHLARELHDEIGQMLTSLSLALTVSERLPPERLRERMSQVQRQINQLTAQVRTLSLNLRPAMLDDLGLLPALVWFTRRYADQTSIQVQFQHAGLDGLITPAVGATAYRVVQESLTNVARHAGVIRVRVQVWATTNLLVVQVVDEGRGFDVGTALSSYSSSGLIGMQERVRLAGGTLSIESAPGEGTRVLAEIPLVDVEEPSS